MSVALGALALSCACRWSARPSSRSSSITSTCCPSPRPCRRRRQRLTRPPRQPNTRPRTAHGSRPRAFAAAQTCRTRRCAKWQTLCAACRCCVRHRARPPRRPGLVRLTFAWRPRCGPCGTGGISPCAGASFVGSPAAVHADGRVSAATVCAARPRASGGAPLRRCRSDSAPLRRHARDDRAANARPLHGVARPLGRTACTPGRNATGSYAAFVSLGRTR